ncbi:MAG TPA: type II toxin-antitoxin system VapC family toxin [Jatrophihabitantaceae bacterium]
MRVYLDTSALVKLVQVESGSVALRRYLRRHRSNTRITSTLARTELVRAVAGGGAGAVAHARRLLNRLDQIGLDNEVLDDAGTSAPGAVLRSLDAIHLAAARTVVADLRAVVTYDQRTSAAAAALSLPTVAPV